MPSSPIPLPAIGLIGFGAFGRLVATHLAPLFSLRVHDPFVPDSAIAAAGVAPCSLVEAAACPVVILAAPVSTFAALVRDIAPHLQPGTLVLDVGSVKVRPAQIMRAGLPPDIDVVATHPLFGPQSARSGLRGLKIAVCPVRGDRARQVGAFLRRALGLTVILTTPEAHDREAAAVQGLTHLIAKVLVAMEPLPTRMTTRSFDLVMQAVGMVRHDAPEVYHAIERENPYAAEVRRRFFDLAAQMNDELGEIEVAGVEG
ncbi:prephenate dehydrogenase/arogenate dehydrogenase family protein [Methylobacterium frigidaeris]|uniref:Prephenate/arogenate dehydrogenase domain-containing protein n=1 Tax=Methylobacterium frigidaeris TaxID=2038277 RepID=A0AA37HAF4_9HYPH|nr:prephenate dehydrogenase/arogenate dehydrogenase family protein [Methylobacterium frigidaeris]PIK71342.1 prephenate dehydrogenase [Methylobacterium frigidaeris]GJD62311.1 hypothetical protein MPEAHAMD_2464 [Methylobacterium frigidaeris]